MKKQNGFIPAFLLGRFFIAKLFVMSMMGALLSATTAYASTLEDVKKQGYLKCGVSQGLAGFSSVDDTGKWSGLDVDVCRAVAAAVFGDASKVKYRPLSAKERFAALQTGEIDLLSRNTTWTISRDVNLGVNFTGTTYFDGQGFLVRKELGVKSALELDGSTVCSNQGTTTEQNTADFFRSHKMKYDIVVFEKSDEVVRAYETGRCDVYTTDRSGIAAQRLKLAKPDEHMILPEVISKEPLGPLVREGDDQWFNIVKWSVFAMINAEDLKVSQSNIASFKETLNPKIRRLLGHEGSFGKMLGLEENWAKSIITQVGNYGEVFERNLGLKTPLKLKRGMNNLWSNGGIMYAPPIR